MTPVYIAFIDFTAFLSDGFYRCSGRHVPINAETFSPHS